MAAVGPNEQFFKEFHLQENKTTDLLFKVTAEQKEIDSVAKSIFSKYSGDHQKLEAKIEKISNRLRQIEPDKKSYEDQKIQKLYAKLNDNQIEMLRKNKDVIINELNLQTQLLTEKIKTHTSQASPQIDKKKIFNRQDVHPKKLQTTIKIQQTNQGIQNEKLQEYYQQHDKLQTKGKLNPMRIAQQKKVDKLRRECAIDCIKNKSVPPRVDGVVTEALENLIQEMASLCCNENLGLGSITQVGGGTGSAFFINAGSGDDATRLFVFKPIDLQPGGEHFTKQIDISDIVGQFGGAKGVEVRDYIRATSPFSTHVATIATLPSSQFGISGSNSKGLLIDYSPNIGSVESLILREDESQRDAHLKSLNLPECGEKTPFEWVESVPLSEKGVHDLILHYIGAYYYHSTDENIGNFLVQKTSDNKFEFSFIDGGQSMPTGDTSGLINAAPILRFVHEKIRGDKIPNAIKDFIVNFNKEVQIQSDLRKLVKHGIHEKNSPELQTIQMWFNEAWDEIKSSKDDLQFPTIHGW